jgi:DNA polymerase III epsilon subunit-like protein
MMHTHCMSCTAAQQRSSAAAQQLTESLLSSLSQELCQRAVPLRTCCPPCVHAGLAPLVAAATSRGPPMLLFFDLETTGLREPKRITEVCVVNASETAGAGASTTPRGAEPMFITFVKGGVRMESEASRLTGITDAMVEGDGALEAVMVANLLHWVLQQASSVGGAVPVWIAHNGKR